MCVCLYIYCCVFFVSTLNSFPCDERDRDFPFRFESCRSRYSRRNTYSTQEALTMRARDSHGKKEKEKQEIINFKLPP